MPCRRLRKARASAVSPGPRECRPTRSSLGSTKPGNTPKKLRSFCSASTRCGALKSMACGLMCRTMVQKNDRETETSGSFWRSTVTDIDTRLRAARGLGKGETKASVEAFESLRGRGRPPTRKLPGDDWQYLQMIKHRDKRGCLMEIEAKVVFGDEQAVRQLLGENTAYAERNHLTMRRGFNS